MELRKIAVGVDFSDGSQAALKLAKKVARPGSQLRLVHSIDAAVFWRGPTYADPAVAESIFSDLIRGAKLELDTIAGEELRVGKLGVDVVVKVGRPADEILAASEGCDLTVVGTHGRGALGRMFLGSVAEEVARSNAVPTLIAREGSDEPIERVLIAIDPSGPVRDTLRAAAALAEATGARLEAIHAAYLPPSLPYADDRSLLKLTQALAGHVEKAPLVIGESIRKILGREIPVEIVAGPVAPEICKRATPRDVLVCGTHGRSALGRLVFGSVAAKLVRGAPCPVLVVRPAADESGA